jgi:hypothetical protein
MKEEKVGIVFSWYNLQKVEIKAEGMRAEIFQASLQIGI